jgi:phage terminase large subunit-like protein
MTSLATLMNSGGSLRNALIAWREKKTARGITDSLDWNELVIFYREWQLEALAHQLPPRLGLWDTWLLLGGRGAGKTRAGAEWVRAAVSAKLPYPAKRYARIALIGETAHDAREVMVEGVAGLLRAHPRRERPVWISSRGRLEWPNGAVAETFSADDPESLRGPQFDAAWLDEFAKWRYAEAAFDMLQFGLRVGERPRQIITTTPRPTAILRRLIANERTRISHAVTQANAMHLAPTFLAAMTERYGGTRLGRQELDGEIIEDTPGALWTRAIIENCRTGTAPPLVRVVVAVDPPASAREGADACGIVAAGRSETGLIYVLADESSGGLSPAAWAARAISLWRRQQADALIAESNQGGDMVRAVIREADAEVPVTMVHARRSKWLRAEPVALLYEQRRVKHVGAFPALEDEMCGFGQEGLSTGRSPDRLDALVWAISALAFGASDMRIRSL